MDTLFINNSHLVTVRGLKDEEGFFVNRNATVEATLYESDGVTEVPGAPWPVLLYREDGSNGDYSGDLPPGIEVFDGSRYYLKVRAEVSGRVYEATRTVKAEVRYG